MSKTLFWYIFSNLVKIFLLTTAGLAGIMSFAGLLRPLTENGLDITQVNRLLLYMMPAMCTYSLPVAALFATTMVYGRLSSDNELTAMRAGGISYLSPRRFSIALPALILGLSVATLSLLMLCFIVPLFTLKVEEVMFSNGASLIAGKINREHVFDMKSGMNGATEIYAQSASLLPLDPNDPSAQRVELIGPVITKDAAFTEPGHESIAVHDEYWMARSAIVTIRRDPHAAAWEGGQLFVALEGGVKFPGQFGSGVVAGVEATSFGPREIDSLIPENVKFLDVTRLRELAANPGQSEKITKVTDGLIESIQQRQLYALISQTIDGQGSPFFDFPEDPDTHDHFTIGGPQAITSFAGADLLITAPVSATNSRPLLFVQKSGSQEIFSAHARELHILATPDYGAEDEKKSNASAPPDRLSVIVTMIDADLKTPEGDTEHSKFTRAFSIATPAGFEQYPREDADRFLISKWITPKEIDELRHEQIVVINSVTSELHGRASFALSCLVLVMVGCALGVMFRSGNLLNAFAVSFVPALLCITLIVCGQQAATHVPYDMQHGFRNPLATSLWFIWFGNAMVLGAAVYLTVRLQRQ